MEKINLENNYNKKLLTVFFFLLYSYQGLFYGFFEAIKVIIISKNSSYNQLALLELAYIPVYVKFLFSPFLEIYYSRKFGKRFGYICLFSILLFFLFILFAFKLEYFINSLNIGVLAFLMIIMSFLTSIQDVCIDSLSEENFKDNDSYLGILMQTFGQIGGPIISFNLFLYFHSNNYNNNIYYFCLGFGAYILITTLIVNMKFKEREPKIDNKDSNPLDLYKLFPNFIKNKILLKYLLHLLTFSIGLQFFNSTLLIKIIKKGFTEKDINQIQYTLLPMELFNLFLLNKLNIAKNIFLKYKIIIIFYIIYNISFFISYYLFEENLISYNNFFYLLLFISLFTIVRNLEFSVKSNFNVFSCDQKLGSVYLSTMNSFSNIPGQIYKPIFIILIGKFNYYYLSIFFIAYSFIYYFFITIPFCNQYNMYKKQDFSISDINKKIKKE